MLREIAAHVLAAAADVQPPSTGSSHEVLIAVIGLGGPLGGVLVALIGMLVTRRGGEDKRSEALARYLYRHGVDPDRILTGNEEEADVRIL